jgi:hypothetical protein
MKEDKMGATCSTSRTFNKYHNFKILVDQSLGKRPKFRWESDTKRNIINKEFGVSMVIRFDWYIVCMETNGELS